MRYWVSKAILGLFLVMLAGCQTTELAGTEPITRMGDKTIKAYQNYRLIRKDYPHHNMAFVYDGNSGAFAWAGQPEQNGVGYAVSEALDSCHGLVPNVTCKVLDINGQIIWRGISSAVLAKLNNIPQNVVAGRALPYSEKEHVITTKQKRAFDIYMNEQSKHDNSAFYISKDGRSYGANYMDGPSGYEAAKRNSLRECLVQSGNVPCYLFGIDGKPANEQARAAIYERD